VAVDRVIQACYGAGADGLPALRARLLRELHRAVSFDAAFMAAADPETLLFTAAFADEPLVEAGPMFLDNEFDASPDVNRFAALAIAADPVASLDRATSGERETSARSREIMTPLGMGDEARVALRVDGATWGFLCLHRSGPIGFDQRELAVMGRLAPYIGDAIRRTVAAATMGDRGADVGANGLVIVADDQVVALGGAAEHWLAALGFQAIAPGDRVPLPLLAVARRLEALEVSGATGPTPSARLATTSGELVQLHATRLRDASGTGAIALSIAPADSAQRASLLLAAHGLTPAQRRVAELVLHGCTTRQIVLQLRISEHTVQDHLKAIFDKLGVRSRRELVTAVMRPLH